MQACLQLGRYLLAENSGSCAPHFADEMNEENLGVERGKMVWDDDDDDFEDTHVLSSSAEIWNETTSTDIISHAKIASMQKAW